MISAGASGAIFGLYGALVGFLILRRDSIPGPVLAELLKSAVVFLIYNVFFGVLHSGTDMAAHAGGFLGGLVCGLVISTPITTGFTRRRTLRSVAIGLAFIPVMLGLGPKLPHPIDFQKELTIFGSAEKTVITNYNSILLEAKKHNLSDSQIADRIQKDVIALWSTERRSLATLTGLPSRQQQIVGLLMTYMDARQQAWGKLVHGLQLHNRDLIRQSMQEQTEAQNQLKESMKAANL